MAYVNVVEWKTDHVCEWLKGLDSSVLPYVHSFTNHGVNGQQLLSLRPEDLEQLGVFKLGHQEIILQAVEYLRDFHYELDRENLQLLALRLSCQAHSLHNELVRQTDSKPVTTQTLSDVAAVVTAVKPLVRWLDRAPFSGHLDYNEKKTDLMRLSLEMAMCAQRDRFAEKPIEEIRMTCEQLATLADYIIQDVADPMILQPASLDLATLKKKPGDDIGFYILPSFHGAHQIVEIKFGSAAHQCGKIEEGDEIVQVNYQTVVGWERKNVLELFRESPAEVLLTLKRRPRHTKVYGQIYIKPYRLPSNKKMPYATRWQYNLPSPRPELLTIPDFTMPLPRHQQKNPSPSPASTMDSVNLLDTITMNSSDSDSEVEPQLSTRLYSTKPRNLVQRRATITGASPTTKHCINIEQFWRELKQEHSTTFQLRDKAASCAHGLDTMPSSNVRPQTCLGIEQSKKKRKVEEDRKVQFEEKSDETEGRIDKNTFLIKRETTVANEKNGRHVVDLNVSNNNSKGDTSVPCVENRNEVVGENVCSSNKEDCQGQLHKERGKLDKSHSTPAYDLIGSEEFAERKLEPLSINSKLSLVTSNSRGTCILTLNKNDTTLNQERDNVGKGVRGNVMQKVSNIEKNMRCNESDRKVPEQTSSNKGASSHIKGNSPNARVVSPVDVETAVPSSQHNASNTSDEHGYKGDAFKTSNLLSSRESSEEKSESISSYIEGTLDSSSSSSDLDSTLRQHIQTTNVKSLESLALDEKDESEDADSRAEPGRFPADRQMDQHSNYDSSTPIWQPIESELKPEATKRPSVKQRSTPPEPPPRRYFTKPAPLNLNLTTNSSPEYSEKPRVPVRLVKPSDIKKPELGAVSPRFEHFEVKRRNDRLDNYSDFAERSMDFIDEPVVTVSDHKHLPNFYGQTDVPETSYSCGERSSHGKYEPFDEKFGAQSRVADPQKLEPYHPSDSPDGFAHSKQIPSPESTLHKSRTHEKDSKEKGVVNRAMMVARSIGLHGNSSKSMTGSPRNSRKNSNTLAKKRNTSVKELGPGDLEGILTYRCRGSGGSWARALFVVKNSCMYRFKSQDSTKADCLIALTGFTASVASEVKSRKFAFKVYHTGTMFYFAADTEDSLILWLDTINKATLGADVSNRASALFNETDDSDSENKQKNAHKSLIPGKSFGSLKKLGKKDAATNKEQEMSGASLDRKYLRFLGAKNVPVPTAQFRSYRRVLPTSTPKKLETLSNSPDLQVTVAGSTFYGLSASHSANDVPGTSQDMGDYRRSTDRSYSSHGRRIDESHGFMTLEEFMLSYNQEGESSPMSANRMNSSSYPSATPLAADHVHYQHASFDNNTANNLMIKHFNDLPTTNGAIYGQIGYSEDGSSLASSSAHGSAQPKDAGHTATPSDESYHNEWIQNEPIYNKSRKSAAKKTWETGCINKRRTQSSVYAPAKRGEIAQKPQNSNDGKQGSLACYKTEEARHSDDVYERNKSKHHINEATGYGQIKSSNLRELPLQASVHRIIRNDGFSGSSGDLTSHVSETMQRSKKEVSVSRKGSFNLSDHRSKTAAAHQAPDKYWAESLDKTRLKNVTQYQPPPIPSLQSSSNEQDGMKAAFEMHLDKGEGGQQKTSRLKSFFGSRSTKPNTLELPKEPQKTLLGSPRLHRAIFRDKNANQRQSAQSGAQSPGDSGISQTYSSFSGNSQSQTLSHSLSSVSSNSDWSSDTPSLNKGSTSFAATKKAHTINKSLSPPTLPYIPPPTSPPPDYPPSIETLERYRSYSPSAVSSFQRNSKSCQYKSEE